MTQRWRMIGCRGCGSAIVEAALVLAGVPYDREEVDYTQAGPARIRDVATAAGFGRFRPAASTPFNNVLEVRP